MQKHKFEAIGTQWSIDTPAELSAAVRTEIAQRIAQFDQAYSRFRDDSLVAKLRVPGEYEFPDDSRELIAFYSALYKVTEGAVTPLVGGVLEQAGYDAQYSLRPDTDIQPVAKWDDVMHWRGNKVTVKRPIVFDVGAAGKGYLVDLVAEILMSHNIDEYVIDASGDIRHHGAQPEQIGMENPYNPATVLGIIPLQNASLCASASNRRAWGDWHHIIDPRTAQPAKDIVATWVVAPSAMVADGLATALFFVPPTSLSQWDFQAARLWADGRLEYTTNFVGELFI